MRLTAIKGVIKTENSIDAHNRTKLSMRERERERDHWIDGGREKAQSGLRFSRFLQQKRKWKQRQNKINDDY